MATFEAQVEALTGLAIAGSSAPTQTELTQFLTDGAKEVLNSMPRLRQEMFTTSNTLNGSATTLTLLGSEVFSVTRADGTINQPCRKIPAKLSGRALDSSDMIAVSVTDPAYYIENNILKIIPTPTDANAAQVETLAYPAVAFGDSLVAKFPDDGEYLIPLYASVKSFQNALSAKSGNTNITTAFALLKAAVDQAETAADKFESADESVFGDENTFLTTNSQLTRVKAALDDAEDVINADEPSATTDAYGAQANEDIELVSSAINIAQSEIRRAQAHLQEWVAIGDMRVKEVNVALSEADGYAKEIQSRLAVDSTEYSWMEKQQAKLQADYDKGLAQLVR